jgi:hypothetical protein
MLLADGKESGGRMGTAPSARLHVPLQPWMTDPITPVALWGATAIVGGVLALEWLLWAGLAGLAGYSLSGSV